MITLLQLVGGLAILTVGAELLVRGASRLAVLARISPLVIGLTVVAYGTSAPELTVSVITAYKGQPDLSLGNVVGSNIFNVLFILGVSALIVPLTVNRQLLKVDVPLMVIVSGLVWVLGRDGRLSLIESAGFVAGIIGYTVWTIYASRRENAAVQAEFAGEFGEAAQLSPSRSKGIGALISLGLLIAGLVLLVAGSNWFVEGAITVARWAQLSELVIGLTIVAAGTSLPEVATSIVAALKGERDIAVGNVVGSNLFNILGVLGVAGLVGGDGVAISESALQFDIPVMVAVAVACLPIFFTGHSISRAEGALLLFYEVLYTGWLLFAASGHPAIRGLGWLVIVFIFPLTAIGLGFGLWRHLRERSAGHQATTTH